MKVRVLGSNVILTSEQGRLILSLNECLELVSDEFQFEIGQCLLNLLKKAGAVSVSKPKMNRVPMPELYVCRYSVNLLEGEN